MASARAACLAVNGVTPPGAMAAVPGKVDVAHDGKRATLLRVTDSHAQLETHLDYLPGASPEFQRMGGFARLKTALEREREKARAAGACSRSACQNIRKTFAKAKGVSPDQVVELPGVPTRRAEWFSSSSSSRKAGVYKAMTRGVD